MLINHETTAVILTNPTLEEKYIWKNTILKSKETFEGYTNEEIPVARINRVLTGEETKLLFNPNLTLNESNLEVSRRISLARTAHGKNSKASIYHRHW